MAVCGVRAAQPSGVYTSDRPRGTLSMRRLVALAAAAAALRPARLPLMPFGADEVLVPGQSRYLHLYEARFLALFEYCKSDADNDCVLGFFAGDDALLRCATRARVDAWERLDVGIGVTVRGVARCAIANVEQAQDRPFLVAELGALEDAADGDDAAAAAAVEELADEVDALAAKHDIETTRQNELAVDPRALLEDGAKKAPGRTTGLRDRAAALARDARDGDSDEGELFSFLALEGAPADVKLKMLASTSRGERLAAARAELERQRAELAAKASLKSLNLSWGDD